MAFHTPRRHDDIRGISLCAGVGGLDLGLHLAIPGYRTVCFVERNAHAAAALVARLADASLAPALVWDDLRSFDGRPWRNRIHILSAGYPCQPFTLSGLRKGEDDPRHLWPEVARIVGEIAPLKVFFENVPGHLSLGFQDVTRDLQEMGYRVAARVVSAAEVGGPHTRERMFILGHANVQELGQQGVHPAQLGRVGLPVRSEPDRQPDGAPQPGDVLDASAPAPRCGGLEGQAPSIFPPEPGCLAEWRETLRARPDLEPCVHRLDHGMADWLDRTSEAGNGVVPLAAARAYLSLTEALTGY